MLFHKFKVKISNYRRKIITKIIVTKREKEHKYIELYLKELEYHYETKNHLMGNEYRKAHEDSIKILKELK